MLQSNGPYSVATLKYFFFFKIFLPILSPRPVCDGMKLQTLSLNFQPSINWANLAVELLLIASSEGLKTDLMMLYCEWYRCLFYFQWHGNYSTIFSYDLSNVFAHTQLVYMCHVTEYIPIPQLKLGNMQVTLCNIFSKLHMLQKNIQRIINTP